MPEIFSLQPSRHQRRALFAVYLLAAATAAAVLQPGWFAALAALLAVLIGWRETRLLEPRRPLRLELRAGRAGIGLEQGGQSYFYNKYKVYACRWFAILRLIDGHHGRTLILNSDCFATEDAYRRLRFRLGMSRDAD